jgi:CHASE1-domain containing sensor protein
MAMAQNKMMTIVILAAILLAGVGAVGLVYFAPSNQPVAVLDTNTPTSTQTDQSTVSNSQTLQTGVMQRSDYTSLDFGLVTQGRLPVQPPVAVGKTDPFQ